MVLPVAPVPPMITAAMETVLLAAIAVSISTIVEYEY